jgi:formylglycine-generating enzyme required for sulfatase activity
VSWLSRKSGKAYRLLTEAEREYVTRAGTTTPFWWGNSILTSQANYDGNYSYGDGAKGEYRSRTMPVYSFDPNPWGLYQVHGNVWEWTEDCWSDSNGGVLRDGNARAVDGCGGRAVRGGSWASLPKLLRSAQRNGWNAEVRNDFIGFRVARTLNP